VRLGPDAARYWHAAGGGKVPRPFHARWLLPVLLGQDAKAWRFVWLASWPLLAFGMVAWRLVDGDEWTVAAAAAALLLGLPGILGPQVSIPVQTDLPATALTVLGVACFSLDHPLQWAAGMLLVAVASTMRETAPVWAAVWAWSPLPLVALIVPAVAWLVIKPGPDPLGAKFEEIAAHPVRAGLAFHSGRWRDGWLMVAPWGVCLAALVHPSPQLVVALVLAYGLLLVATDSVRLYQHAAGPVMAVAAAQVIPTGWLLLAVVVHVVWWRTPERV
jgi:hypothetical protein